MAEEEKKEQAAEGEEAPEKEETAAEPEKKEKPAKEKKPKGSRNPFKSRKFKHGSLSVVFTVIFIAAVVLVNVIFNLIMERLDVVGDLTENKLFSAGEEIMEFTKLDSSTVHFYFTSEKETLENASDAVYKQSVELIRRLVSANDGYDVTYVDLLKNPSFSEKHGVSKEGSLLIECENTGRSKSFEIFNDFKRYVMPDGKSYTASDQTLQMMMMYGYRATEENSIAEQEILSALVSVTKLNPVKAAFTLGFGETENTALAGLLEKNAYVVETINIDQAAEIPQEYDVLIMNAPTMDYSDEALTKVDEWLSNGGLYGKNLVYFAPVSEPVSAPRLNAYLDEWGIGVGDSFVVQLNNDYAYMIPGYPNLIQMGEIVTDTSYYSAMKNDGSTTFRANGVRPIFSKWTEKSIYKNTTVLRSYGDNCALYPFDATAEWSENDAEKGQFDMIVEASKVRFDNNTPVYSRIIAAGSETLFAQSYLEATNYNNADLAIAIFNTISGNTDKQITITPKSFTAKTYEITGAQQAGIGLTFAVIIPVVIIILGIVIWLRRRHL